MSIRQTYSYPIFQSGNRLVRPPYPAVVGHVPDRVHDVTTWMDRWPATTPAGATGSYQPGQDLPLRVGGVRWIPPGPPTWQMRTPGHRSFGASIGAPAPATRYNVILGP
jgi:hypothetical protein